MRLEKNGVHRESPGCSSQFHAHQRTRDRQPGNLQHVGFKYPSIRIPLPKALPKVSGLPLFAIFAFLIILLLSSHMILMAAPRPTLLPTWQHSFVGYLAHQHLPQDDACSNGKQSTRNSCKRWELYNGPVLVAVIFLRQTF